MANGTPTGITYQTLDRYWPNGRTLRGLAADFVPASFSSVNIGSNPDIDNLLEFSISTRVFCRTTGGGAGGKFYQKGDTTRFEVTTGDASYARLYGKVTYSGTSAETLTHLVNGSLSFNHTHHVTFTYSESGDRKIHIYIDGVESAYNYQTPSVGNRTSDAAGYGCIGNYPTYDRYFDGLLSEFLIHDHALTLPEIRWLAHDLWHTPPPELCVDVFEEWRSISPSKAPNGMLVFQFDDGFADAYTTAFPIFQAHGKQAVAAVITSLINAPTRLSAAQIVGLKTAGWDIASHSKTHADPQDLSEAQLRIEMLDSRTALEAIVGQVKHYAWPFSCPSEVFRQVAVDYYDSATDGGLYDYPPFNAYAIGHITIDDPAGLASFKAYMDAAKAGKHLLTFIMHNMGAGDDVTLDSLLTYADLIGIPVLTRTQALTKTTAVCPFNLHGRASFRCINHDTGIHRWAERAFIPLPDGIFAFTAYTNGGIIDATVCTPFLSTGSTNMLTEFNYTPLGGGKWLCWSPFDFGDQLLYNGVEIPPGVTVYLSKPTATWVP